jgi:ABC-2 type transport system permease protein
MLPSIVKLLRLRVRLAWNTFKHRRLGQKIGYLLALFGMLAFAAFLIFLSWGILQFFSNPRMQREFAELGMGEAFRNVLVQLPVLFCAGAFVVGLFANFGVLLQGLYLSGDMEFLLTAPVPARSVFLSKLIQAILPNLLLLALVSGPALIGLGLAQAYTIPYFVLVPVILSLLVVLGAGLSSILVMLVVRLVNPRRAAEVLGLVGGLTAFICSQSGQLAGRFDGVDVSTDQLAGMAETVGVFAAAWNPLAWPGLGLTHIGQGDWALGLGFTGLTLIVTAGLFAVTLTVAERMYFSGWSRVQLGTKEKKRKPALKPETSAEPGARSRPGAGRWFANLFPAPAWAIILKDARLYRRDIRNLSNLIFPIILAVIWTISIFRERDEIPSSAQTFFDSSSLGIGIFMAMMFVMRFGFGGFSLEGKQWWILKTSPVHPLHLVLAKYTVALLPPSVFGVVYLLVAAFFRRITLPLLAYQIAAELIVVAGMAALTLSFGIWGARFDWTNPSEVSGGAVGCLGGMLTFGFVGLAGGVFIGLPILAEMFQFPWIAGYGSALFLGVLLSGLGGGLPLVFAARRIPRLGEENSKKSGKREKK